MHKEVVGQERAVEVVASTMRRLRTGLGKKGKPAGVFLLVGPTGVGKTLTAKILAKTYFGSADKMLRFDMSEYQDINSLDRFLGSTRTGEPGQFVTAVRDNPFSLILLDEIEKADKNVLNIFLQVFDEGRLTDVFGRKINFEQNIIIATSNAGAEYIRDMVKEGIDPSIEKERIVDVLIKGGYFRPELLNRFDEIVIFHPLSQAQVGVISGLLINGLAARLKEQGYIFQPTQEVIDYVSRVGFDPQFGARPMERVIRDKVESTIAGKILDGSISKGTPFSLSVEDLK
jgi:ATP-dependent Clp protease ATP-binding subunit ClpA